MRNIFVDFEMNPVDVEYAEERLISNYEIIEIGAVMLDGNNCRISEFKQYIKPGYNEVVEERITGLTGITTEMLLDMPEFKEAITYFFEWCGDAGDIEAVYAWSDNDFRQVVHEMKLKNVEPDSNVLEMFDRWKDFQKTFSGLVGLDRPMSLSNAIEAVGRKFLGTAHDALTDAVNTAELYVASKDDAETKRMIELLERTRRPKAPLQTALGDLFDFGNLELD